MMIPRIYDDDSGGTQIHRRFFFDCEGPMPLFFFNAARKVDHKLRLDQTQEMHKSAVKGQCHIFGPEFDANVSHSLVCRIVALFPGFQVCVAEKPRAADSQALAPMPETTSDHGCKAAPFSSRILNPILILSPGSRLR